MGKAPERAFRLAVCLLPLCAACVPARVEFSGESLGVDAAQRAAWADRVDWSDWGAFLSSAATDQGIDRAGAAAQRPRLHRFLSMLAEIGPQHTPRLLASRDHQLAYYINAYNAAIQFTNDALLADSYLPALKAAMRDTAYSFTIDGRRLTPADLRREALKLAGDDWRVELALSDGRAIGPPLWRRPYLGDMLDGQLDDAVRRAVASPRVVAMSHTEVKQLRLWWRLYALRERLVADYEARTGAKGAAVVNALLYWADSLRRAELQGAVGYPIVSLRDDASFDFTQQVHAGAEAPAR